MSSKAKGKAFRKYNPNKSKAAENPFDKFANSKKKHEVLNRRVKGEDRNVGRAREKALEDRKTKLMADYKSSQKSNVFADRRFGEGDANLSLEEKMFMRFQKEKITKVKKSAKFNLDESEEVTLTHQGKALSEYTSGPPSHWSDEEDDDENLGRDVVNTLHFGGGFQPTGKATDDEGATFKKFDSRDALQEIVMKSKLAKLEKREAKDAQEESRVTLDSAYEDLISSSLLDFKPTKRDRSEDVDNANGKQDPNAVGYDSALRAMAFETRARPTDRTKSKEEVAAAELKRLETLEAERQRRMRAADPDDALIDSAMKEKNITGKKKKRATDDDIDDLYGSSGHHNREQDSDDYDSEDSEDDEGDEVDEFGNSHSILDEVSDEDDEEEEEETEDRDEDMASDSDEDDDDEDEEEEDSDSDEDEPKSKKMSASSRVKKAKALDESEKPSSKSTTKSKSVALDETVNPDMPHVLHCPTSLEDFDTLLNDFVINPRDDLPALLSRVVASSSVHLPAVGTSKATNMSKMSVFLDILFIHFIRVGDSLLEVSEQDDIDIVMAQVHCLSSVIFQLAQDVPDACRVSAVKLIKNMHANLQRRMRMYHAGECSSCWLSLGHILLLQEFGHLFATSDFKHGIVGPCFFLMCQCLTQCPLVTLADVSSGLLLTCIILNYTEKSEKFVPEAFMFIERLIEVILEDNAAPKPDNIEDEENQLPFMMSYFLAEPVVVDGPRAIPWLFFNPDLAVSASDAQQGAVSMFHAIFSVVSQLSEKFKSNVAYPELFKELVTLFNKINTATEGEFESAPYFTAHPKHSELIKAVQTNCEAIFSTRQCLKWRVPQRKVEKMLTPVFDVDYNLKKSVNTTNNDAVKLKVLQKQVKREEKATMRELRRDADFIDRERTKEKDLVRNARKEERAKNFAWLEEQHATFKQQVRTSKGALKGGGNGDVRPPKKRVKRSKATSR